MVQSDFSCSARAESKIDTPKAAFRRCLQLPGGDGGGFHVAKGKQGVLLRMAYGGQAINDTTRHLSGCSGGGLRKEGCSARAPNTARRGMLGGHGLGGRHGRHGHGGPAFAWLRRAGPPSHGYGAASGMVGAQTGRFQGGGDGWEFNAKGKDAKTQRKAQRSRFQKGGGGFSREKAQKTQRGGAATEKTD